MRRFELKVQNSEMELVALKNHTQFSSPKQTSWHRHHTNLVQLSLKKFVEERQCMVETTTLNTALHAATIVMEKMKKAMLLSLISMGILVEVVMVKMILAEMRFDASC